MAARDRMILVCGRASGVGVGCDICTGDLEALVTHANAPLTPAGRLRLAPSDGRCAAATKALPGCRISPAGRAPARTAPRTRTERRVIKVRVLRRWGPARIAFLLGLNPSTVHRILTRYRLTHLDRATGHPIRRDEHPAPGDLVHVDIKKLGNIPDGGGHKVLGCAAGARNSNAHRDPAGPRKLSNRANLGYSYLHNAVDANPWQS